VKQKTHTLTHTVTQNAIFFARSLAAIKRSGTPGRARLPVH